MLKSRPSFCFQESHVARWCFTTLLTLLALPLMADTKAEDPPPTGCLFNPSWITSPSPIDEVPATGEENGKPDSTFCDFYQFSWQNFLYLVSPSSNNTSNSRNAYLANFIDSKQFLPFSSKDKTLCKDGSSQPTFFGTMPTGLKPRDWISLDDVLDPEIHQAGSQVVIYDVNGKAAIYSTRFSPNLCDVEKIVPHPYFPKGTTELKMAWRILGEKDDPNLYFTTQAPAGSLGDDKSHTLGLIGFHIAVVTDAHPEMIWITIEHNLNNPLCNGEERDLPKPMSSHSWSFTSDECLKNPAKCNFNEPEDPPEAGIDGEPTPICQELPFGQLPDDIDPEVNDNPANQKAIKDLYAAFVGTENKPKWAEVWTHYRMVGALWLSQPYSKDPRAKPENFNSTGTYERGNPGERTHQRGSLALANSVAETDFQGKEDDVSGLRNCFGCHGFATNSAKMVLPIQKHGEDPKKPYYKGTGTISHIFGKIFDSVCEHQEYVSSDHGRVFNYYFTSSDPDEIVDGCQFVCDAGIGHGNEIYIWTGKFKENEERVTDCQCCRPQKYK